MRDPRRPQAWPASDLVDPVLHLGLVLLALLTLAVERPAQAADRRVVLGVPSGILDEASQAQLLLAVQAHLSSLGVVAELAPIEMTARGDVALGSATEQAALCVAWLSPELDELMVMTPSLGQQVRVRQLPPDTEGWLSRCEVIAALLHSELGAQITPVVADTAPADSPAPKPGRHVTTTVLLSVRWAPFVMSSDSPFLQGVAVGAGVEIARRVTFHASMGLVQPADLGLGGATLGRWPGRIAVALLLPRESLELELELGALLDVWKVLALGYDPADEAAAVAHLDVAIAPAGRVRYRVTPWLAPFVEVGADIYLQRRTFAMGDSVLVARDPALLRVGVGVTFLLEAR